MNNDSNCKMEAEEIKQGSILRNIPTGFASCLIPHKIFSCIMVGI